MSNMRDHLVAINEILTYMANNQLDQAAEVAESRLGMSSLESHGASHMAKFIPEGMRQTGTSMHRAASRFATASNDGCISTVLPIIGCVWRDIGGIGFMFQQGANTAHNVRISALAI